MGKKAQVILCVTVLALSIQAAVPRFAGATEPQTVVFEGTGATCEEALADAKAQLDDYAAGLAEGTEIVIQSSSCTVSLGGGGSTSQIRAELIGVG